MSETTNDSRVAVLVTGVGGGGHGHEIVKALRLAGDYRLIGLDMNPCSYGLFDVDHAYIVSAASEPDYIDNLLAIAKKHDARVVIHGSEPELKIISAHRARLSAAGLLPLVNAADVIDLCMDKWATVTALRKAGLTVPESALVTSAADIPKAFPLPAVVKPSVGGGGSNNTFLVQDREELEYACKHVTSHGIVAILQEYIGTPQDEYTVGVLHTLDGRLVGSLAVRREIMSGLSNRIKIPNRTGRIELSPVLAVSSGVSQGIVDDFPEVRRACEAIAEALGSRGPMNVQCRFVDGVLYPFEVNPRFSGTTNIRAIMGFNEPDLLIKHHVLGQQIPTPIRYKFGQVMRALSERLVTDLAPVPRWAGDVRPGRSER